MPAFGSPTVPGWWWSMPAERRRCWRLGGERAVEKGEDVLLIVGEGAGVTCGYLVEPRKAKDG